MVLNADERERARIGHGGTGSRRRTLRDDKRRPGSAVRAFFLHNDVWPFLWYGECRCEHALCIALVLNKINIFVYEKPTPCACA